MGDNNRYSHWNHCRWTNPDCTYGYQGQGDWRPQESAWHGCQHGSDSERQRNTGKMLFTRIPGVPPRNIMGKTMPPSRFQALEL